MTELLMRTRVRINNFVDEDLIPDYVQFNNVKTFVIIGCSGLKNCKGFPKKCNYFRLQNCVNLETLEGFPKGAKYDVFSLRYDSGYYHHKLKSYKGMPDADFVSIDGLKFKNLNGMGDTKELSIQYCDDLIKLNPPKSTKDLTILYCRKLKDLSKMHKMDQIIVENYNLPKEIFAKFTENLQYS